MNIGYTKAYRKELESDIWKMPPLYQRVFFYLRQKAAWQPEIFPTVKTCGIALNPGQLITSFSVIADGVSWYEYGVKKTPNKKTIGGILRWLEGNAMVTTFSNRHGTFIIVTNWDSYNGKDKEKVTPKKRIKVTQKKRQLDTLKEGKKNKEKIYPNKIKTFVEDYINYISKTFQNKAPKSTPALFQKSCESISKLKRLDGFEEDYIFNVLRWAQKDSFWQSQILSLSAIRTKSKNNDNIKFKTLAIAYDKTNKEPITEKRTTVFTVKPEHRGQE